VKVVRRTFEALKYPKGSPERARLNLDGLTSEYMPSYRYVLRLDDGSRPFAPLTFRTKREGEAKLKELEEMNAKA
jgi:hypothetical protein